MIIYISAPVVEAQLLLPRFTYVDFFKIQSVVTFLLRLLDSKG